MYWTNTNGGLEGLFRVEFIHQLTKRELMKVTGHKSSSMLARYYNPKASELALKLG
jgi:hypothetical protein